MASLGFAKANNKTKIGMTKNGFGNKNFDT